MTCKTRSKRRWPDMRLPNLLRERSGATLETCDKLLVEWEQCLSEDDQVRSGFKSAGANHANGSSPFFAQHPVFDLVRMMTVVQRNVAKHDEHAIAVVLFVPSRDCPLIRCEGA